MRFDPNYHSILTQSLSDSSASVQRLTGELSSGLRVGKLSDDPVAASSNVLLAQAISRGDAFVSSAGSHESLLQATDSTLGEVVSQVTSAIGLAVSAGNGTLSSSNLSAIQKQVSDIRDSIVGLANTSYLGTYLFSGSAGNIKPFSLDQATTPATTTYSGDAITRTATTPDGQQIPLNVAGSSVFTAASANLLGTLNQLVADLGSGNTGAVASDSSSLTAALGNISVQRSVVGSSLSRLQATSSYTSSQETLLKAQQSALLSADPAQIATDLQSAEVQHQALLSVIASTGKQNLFDYIK